MKGQMRFRTLSLVLLCVAAAGSFGFGISRAHARQFTPNYILSDREMTDAGSLTAAQVQSFFERIGSTLRSYSQVVNGVSKTAAQIITDSARTHQISPKYLIVLIQKEQSLVTDQTPSERQFNWAAGYGVCDSCSTDDPAIQQFRGFANQIDNAAKQNRRYYTSPQNYRYQVNRPISTDGITVTPANQATANLYNYTPHIHGNELFWDLWNRWFTLKYPDGTLVRARGEGGIWLIRNGKRSPFLSRAAFHTQYDIRRVLEIDKAELEAYEYGTPIKFPNYSLLQAPTGGVYLLVDNFKRAITSREAFRRLGYNPEELVKVSWNDLNVIPNGQPITENTIYPSGIIFQSKQTGGIYQVKDGIIHTIHAREIYRSQFGSRRPIPVNQADLDQYPKGDPVPFRDGEIVTSPGNRAVFFVSNGALRPVASIQAFNALGLKWINLIKTSDSVLARFPMGELIDVVTIP